MKPPSKRPLAYHGYLTTLSKRLINSRPVIQEQGAVDSEHLATKSDITVVCISDTHNTQPDLPPGDVLLHAGDLTQDGSFTELQAQLDWLNSQPHTYKVIIAGSHDLLLDDAFVKQHRTMIEVKPGATKADLQFGDLNYLCDESITLIFPHICGFGQTRELIMYGSPTTVEGGTRAFQVSRDQNAWTGRLGETYHSSKPSDYTLDILLMHGPPKGHLDKCGKGNVFLTAEIARIRPRLVIIYAFMR